MELYSFPSNMTLYCSVRRLNRLAVTLHKQASWNTDFSMFIEYAFLKQVFTLCFKMKPVVIVYIISSIKWVFLNPYLTLYYIHGCNGQSDKSTICYNDVLLLSKMCLVE